MSVRPKWVNQIREEIVEPDRLIVDPHHHFWMESRWGRYLLDDLWADTESGHRIEKTVFLECGAEYREDGPDAMKPLGETEFVADLAARSKEGDGATVSAIIGHADLHLGAKVADVLQAQIETANGLFRGIRHSVSWDQSDELSRSGSNPVPHQYFQDGFRDGFNQLAPLGLSFDAWNYHPQIPELTDLAKTFPDTTVIVNHLGGPLGIASYAGRREEIFETWKQSYAELSKCPNVFAKIGGIAMGLNGFGWHERDLPPTSDEIADAQQPYYLHAIDCFGPDRCMFESNFPVEKQSVSYHVLWNAFKKISADFTEDEKDALFRRTAVRVYRL